MADCTKFPVTQVFPLDYNSSFYIFLVVKGIKMRIHFMEVVSYYNKDKKLYIEMHVN